MRPLRWLSVVAPVVAVAIIELVSDGLLDEAFPFPLDTIVVVVLVALLAWGFSAIAFDRIDRLSTELRTRNADLERREASARALHRVSVAVAALADLDEILATIVDQARELLAADVAVLLLYGPDGIARLTAASGADDAIDRAGGFPGADAARFVRPDLAIARLEAPLQRAGATIGILMVGSRLEHGLAADEVETLSSLANQAAIATENARLHARLRELAVVAERERIAREMHDGLAQVLGYVNTKSQAIEELLAAGRTDEARSALRELAAAARSIYVDVREAILGLRSPVVPGVGLVAAVDDYVLRFAEAAKIAIRVERLGNGASPRAGARCRGAGLPDRPGSPDERAQARPSPAVPRWSSRSTRRASMWSSRTTVADSADRLGSPIARTTVFGRCASGPTASGRPSIGRPRPRAASGSISRSPPRRTPCGPSP